MTGGCASRLATQTENGAPFWPTCQDPADHGGLHHYGHYQDVMWAWSDHDAMTADEIAAITAVTPLSLSGVGVAGKATRRRAVTHP